MAAATTKRTTRKNFGMASSISRRLFAAIQLDDDLSANHRYAAEHAPVPFNLILRPCRLVCVVAQLHRRASVHRHHLADQAHRLKVMLAARMASAEVVRQQRAPACAETDAPVEVLVQ